MTDQSAGDLPTQPKPKRRWTRRPKTVLNKPIEKPKAPVPAQLKAAAELAGLTVTACPSACNEKGCVISGRPYCAHPRKGGLQATDISNVAAMNRIAAAQRLLARKAVDAAHAQV